MVVLSKSIEPSVIIASENTKRTEKSIHKENLELPTKTHLNPSTPYVSGLKYDAISIHSGAAFNGNNAPDKKNSGITKKLDTI